MISASFLLLAAIAAAAPVIRVDQIGYAADAPKVAAVSTSSAASFTVHRVGDGAEVFRGTLSAPRLDPQSGDTIGDADFSQLTTPGRYEIRVGANRSDSFDVAPDPYRSLLRLTTRSYYGQRCGTAVDLGGGYAHPVCHTEARFDASSGRSGASSASRGWHDAGDYGRYVVNSGIATGTLLWAYELYPKTFSTLDLSIPESANATPDLLDEVRWNLDWVRAMQDSDGGVWHKQTSRSFPGFVPPQDDHKISYVIGTGSAPYKSSCATADFAAVMAIAARVYRPFDRGFAEQSLQAARRAWSWLKVNPNVQFKNPRFVLTGEYGDSDCSDERLWAAAELWRTARVPGTDAYLRKHAAEMLRAIGPAAPPSWRSVAPLAAWTYVLSGKGDARLTADLRRRSMVAAGDIALRAERHPYRIPLVERDYVWGSNGVAANYAMQLLVANRMHPDARYVDAARDIVHYLLGRNTHAISFVTGTGTRAVMHPHHRPSGSDGIAAPWPGLLAGGPNRDRQDAALKKFPPGTPPARLYADAQDSFSSNEIAINWNAPLVFVLAGLGQ